MQFVLLDGIRYLYYRIYIYYMYFVFKGTSAPAQQGLAACLDLRVCRASAQLRL